MNTDGFRDTTSTRKKRMGMTQSEDDMVFPNPYAPMKNSNVASVPSVTESAIVDGDVPMVLKSSTPTVDQKATEDGRKSIPVNRSGNGDVKELTSRSKRLSANFSIDFAKTPSGSTSVITGKGVVAQAQSKARGQGTAQPTASASKPRFGATSSAGIANHTPASTSATSLTRPVLKGGRIDSRGRERPPASKAFEYVLRPEAVVRCSVSDALGMEREKDMAHDFFWIGRVPCRTIILVGILVGVGCWEKRVVYTLDDGMGVIDCVVKVASTTSASASGPPPPPRPIARVGAFVSIKGRLEPKFDTRVVNVAEISLCRSANEELEHVQQVRKLHKELYDLDETFVIPPPAMLPPAEPTTPRRSKEGPQVGGDDSETPTRNAMGDGPPPMSSPVSVAASVSSSPVRPSTPKQAKPDEVRSLPARLRHPSRLHTGDLTENTFRIYIKHYIDHAHLISNAAVAELHATPTKRWRTSPTDAHSPETPRPHNKGKGKKRESSPDDESQTLGLTLSFLRRVPELHLLAVRVVRAVSARQAREERKKLGEIVTIGDRSRTSVKEKTRKKERPPELPPDKLRARMKRLFQWALVQLLQDGSIILWDGSVRPCPAAEDMNFDGDASMLLWKTHSTIASFSTTTNGTSTTMWDNDEDPSLLFPSPPPSPSKAEEAYTPMTPDVLVPPVRSALERLVKRKREEGNPYAGAGLNEVMRSVVRGDDRFRWVLEWSVEDALKVLQERGEVRKMKSGEWHWVGS